MTMFVASPEAAERTTVTTPRTAINESKTNFKASFQNARLQNHNLIHNRR
jgi:hypothetical protein